MGARSEQGHGAGCWRCGIPRGVHNGRRWVFQKRRLSCWREDVAEQVAAADGGRDAGFSTYTVSQRDRRC